jgi:putative resolvase
VTRLSEWAGQAGATVVRRLLADPRVVTVVVEHRDRLGRMNTELVEAALSAHGRRLVVLDSGVVTDDLVRDTVEVLTSFCARLYGRRGARDRAIKAVGCADSWCRGRQRVGGIGQDVS